MNVENTKKVSVIIPCHNAVKWLPKCFLSLVSQTIGIENLELIFVDDASDDNGETWKMLQEFEHSFPESVMIIRLTENLRQGGARNVGLQYVSGAYIAFVDADDFVNENFLEVVYQKAEETGADIVQFRFDYYVSGMGSVETSKYITPSVRRIHTAQDRKAFLASGDMGCGCWNKLYKRELIQKSQVEFAEHVFYEEPLFTYPLFYYGNVFVFIDDVLYNYRQNDEGTMRKELKNPDSLRMHTQVQLAVWEFMKKTPFFQEFYEEIKEYFLHSYQYETLCFAKQRGIELPEEMKKEMEETVKRVENGCEEL